MGRHPRQASSTGYYHVVARGNRRAAIFRDAADYGQYLRLLAGASTAYAVAVAHYCLMPNHVHLLLHAAGREPLSQALHQLQRRYWFYVRVRGGRGRSIWGQSTGREGLMIGGG